MADASAAAAGGGGGGKTAEGPSLPKTLFLSEINELEKAKSEMDTLRAEFAPAFDDVVKARNARCIVNNETTIAAFEDAQKKLDDIVADIESAKARVVGLKLDLQEDYARIAQDFKSQIQRHIAWFQRKLEANTTNKEEKVEEEKEKYQDKVTALENEIAAIDKATEEYLRTNDAEIAQAQARHRAEPFPYARRLFDAAARNAKSMGRDEFELQPVDFENQREVMLGTVKLALKEDVAKGGVQNPYAKHLQWAKQAVLNATYIAINNARERARDTRIEKLREKQQRTVSVWLKVYAAAANGDDDGAWDCLASASASSSWLSMSTSTLFTTVYKDLVREEEREAARAKVVATTTVAAASWRRAVKQQGKTTVGNTQTPSTKKGTKERPYKIVVIGDTGVGKTSLVRRLVLKTFDSTTVSTTSVEPYSYDVMVVGEHVFFEIWDTQGQERYTNLSANFYRGADGCVIVFDVTDANTFRDLDRWISKFVQANGIESENVSEFPFMVLGNKIDITDRGRVSQKHAIGWCQANGNIQYFDTSAKDEVNVEMAFQTIALHVSNTHNTTSKLPPSSAAGGGVKPKSSRITETRRSLDEAVEAARAAANDAEVHSGHARDHFHDVTVRINSSDIHGAEEAYTQGREEVAKVVSASTRTHEAVVKAESAIRVLGDRETKIQQQSVQESTHAATTSNQSALKAQTDARMALNSADGGGGGELARQAYEITSFATSIKTETNVNHARAEFARLVDRRRVFDAKWTEFSQMAEPTTKDQAMVSALDTATAEAFAAIRELVAAAKTNASAFRDAAKAALVSTEVYSGAVQGFVDRMSAAKEHAQMQTIVAGVQQRAGDASTARQMAKDAKTKFSNESDYSAGSDTEETSDEAITRAITEGNFALRGALDLSSKTDNEYVIALKKAGVKIRERAVKDLEALKQAIDALIQRVDSVSATEVERMITMITEFYDQNAEINMVYTYGTHLVGDLGNDLADLDPAVASKINQLYAAIERAKASGGGGGGGTQPSAAGGGEGALNPIDEAENAIARAGDTVRSASKIVFDTLDGLEKIEAAKQTQKQCDDALEAATTAVSAVKGVGNARLATILAEIKSARDTIATQIAQAAAEGVVALAANVQEFENAALVAANGLLEYLKSNTDSDFQTYITACKAASDDAKAASETAKKAATVAGGGEAAKEYAKAAERSAVHAAKLANANEKLVAFVTAARADKIDKDTVTNAFASWNAARKAVSVDKRDDFLKWKKRAEKYANEVFTDFTAAAEKEAPAAAGGGDGGVGGKGKEGGGGSHTSVAAPALFDADAIWATHVAASASASASAELVDQWDSDDDEDLKNW